MPTYTSKSVVLIQSIDVGIPTPDLFSFPETSVNSDSLADGDILIHVRAISADPYLRMSIRSTGSNKPGSPLSGFIAGKVIHSKNTDW
jgi:NADPH-dependent curcumin reductase CurA